MTKEIILLLIILFFKFFTTNDRPMTIDQRQKTNAQEGKKYILRIIVAKYFLDLYMV